FGHRQGCRRGKLDKKTAASRLCAYRLTFVIAVVLPCGIYAAPLRPMIGQRELPKLEHVKEWTYFG
ncbi:hypothetical protein, partial [Mesorhizobium sp. M7A.F.Ca.CA.001.05.1.1]|uniref:hypothetical protein n=1 Tax=Mesorhizobium sp. M7A.F.Ca.CA.001.05.1.1 TaxID=2496721 RepID=UPI0019CFBC38